MRGQEARAVGSEKEPPRRGSRGPAPAPLFAGLCSKRNTTALPNGGRGKSGHE